ncbi:MAG: hypothetical protein EZS28_025778 [Streblomastix strix]|uniref:Uncharacterized protein n=1 Tax=Streblomastix strix TaxID=222440 RepID=A0A5J4V879_9EUKA|nr:MAG: hypothetical protein EZS28_025778 [Streblomastix strix]
MALKNNDLKGLIPTTHLKLYESLPPHPRRNNVFMQEIHEFVTETNPYISYVPVDSNGTYIDYSNNEPHKRHYAFCCCLNEFAEQCTEDKRYDRIPDIDQNKDNLSDQLEHESRKFPKIPVEQPFKKNPRQAISLKIINLKDIVTGQQLASLTNSFVTAQIDSATVSGVKITIAAITRIFRNTKTFLFSVFFKQLKRGYFIRYEQERYELLIFFRRYNQLLQLLILSIIKSKPMI